MKNPAVAVFVLSFCVFHFTLPAQNWELVENENLPEPQTIHFLNATHGWIGGKNELAYTTDGGNTWNLRTLPDNEVRIRGMHALDENTIFVAGRHDDLEAFIGRSTDGGITWNLQNDFPERLEDIAFASTTTGVSVGRKGLVLRTTNGGDIWSPLSGFGNDDYKHIVFSGETGIMTGEGGIIRRSIDGGQTWSSVSSGTVNDLNGIQFVNSQTVLIAGNGGILLQSNNSGQSFTQMSVPTVNNLRGVFFLNELTGWVVGFVGTILMTNNGGATWIDQSTIIPFQFQRIDGGSILGVFCGNEDNEVYRYQAATSVLFNSGTNLSVYPNPATNYLQVNHPGVYGNYKIHNFQGETVISGKLENETTGIDVKSLAAGNYVLFVPDQTGNFQRLLFTKPN